MSAVLDLAKVIPATPAAVHEALRRAMPGSYTPELANQIAADIVDRLTRPRAGVGQNGGAA